MYGLNSDFQKRDVAIYARVSTEHEAQLSALGNQLDWYKPILAARPDWTLTAQYIDEGITGTSAEKRPQFMKMVEDRAWPFRLQRCGTPPEIPAAGRAHLARNQTEYPDGALRYHRHTDQSHGSPPSD